MQRVDDLIQQVDLDLLDFEDTAVVVDDNVIELFVKLLDFELRLEVDLIVVLDRKSVV